MGMFIGMQGAATAVSVTFQIYFKNTEISGIVQLFAMIPILVFTPLARKMVTRYGKKELAVVGAIASIVGGLGLFIITPDNTNLDLLIYVLCQLVYSLGLGIYSTVSWAMMGDAIDYNEWKTGKREEGVVYSLHSFFRTLAHTFKPAFVVAFVYVQKVVEFTRLLVCVIYFALCYVVFRRHFPSVRLRLLYRFKPLDKRQA